jgi:GNAT superfamily N-acetyltransferase
MNNNSISVVFADSSHAHYAQRICDLIYESALQRGTGIAKRSPEYIAAKMTGGKAVVALDGEKLIGFSYIECWGHGDFVATSGLIVDPEYRHMGLAEQIKRRTFELARRRFPYAKLFSITTSLPVMKLNSRMGYTPVTFSELTEDEEFWRAAATTTSCNATTGACASARVCSTTLPRNPRRYSRAWRPTSCSSKTSSKNCST